MTDSQQVSDESVIGMESNADDGARRMLRCSKVTELSLAPSRAMMSSILRSFLDQVIITPTELIHSARYQTRLYQAGNLLKDAVERAGTLQAKTFKESVPPRVRELHELVTSLILETRKTEQTALPPLQEGQYNNRVREYLAEGNGEIASQKIYRILTENLSGVRTWSEKLDRVIALAEESNDSHLEYIDALLAEVLQCEVVLDNLLGRRISLESRLEDLIELYHGDYPQRKKAPGSTVAPRLVTLIKTKKLTETKLSIESMIVQLLGGRDPLCSPELLTELKGTFSMVQKLQSHGMNLGGLRALEFIERREARLLTSEAVTDYIRGSPTLSHRMQSLFEIHAYTIGNPNKKTIEEFIDRYFAGEDFGRRLLSLEGSTDHKMKLVAQLYRATVKSTIAVETRKTYAQTLIAIQSNFVKESNFFATIEKKMPNSAKKMMAILIMCHEGVFIPGENLERAKAVIIHFLSRPDFFQKFFEGSGGPAEKKEHLEGLKKRLDPLGIPLPKSAPSL